ncbi:protein-glutamate methylesterase/protein-glutamine glutaminase [Cellulomonas oligotrophica]|uniref:Protein-glutamate methylesterase/protein-glutamine glutaminase n=1 Tax=Cellulomonas oligotrophica TaxID=931536 RepID=A0A7Y9FH76_9CELL|nr:chemotaxis response regulator protein-glutamate methylesterase [Cellulomonas oligotrophica]NYD87279.1 two-component system chemotaxis response regulator CheB [Cellulomonas oligotrophica]GIG34196.1 chemotaxis response regulator protein-glutamate methylesterase [Cellulomonas oligotrophica]
MTRTRVLVVDDSVVVRRLVTDALSREPRIDVVGVAANGRIAMSKLDQLAPDVVTMDIEMPEMNGIETVRAMRKAGHKQPVIMFSTLTERGASATLDALAAGATDYVTKPANVGSVQQSLQRVADELIPRILALAPGGRGGALPHPRAGVSAGAAAAATPSPRGPVRLQPPRGTHPVRLVVIGSSTGGPEALSKVISALPALPVPVAVVQHMPPVFTRQLAARLDRLGPSTVSEAVDGEPLLPGHVYIAPGDKHLTVRTKVATLHAVLENGPPVNFCRPAVDVLFRAAVPAVRGEILAVVLTGMGADGRSGCEAVVAGGGTVLVQDEQTSVVWGMPGAVATAGWAHAVYPINEVAGAVARTVNESRTATVGGAS